MMNEQKDADDDDLLLPFVRDATPENPITKSMFPDTDNSLDGEEFEEEDA